MVIFYHQLLLLIGAGSIAHALNWTHPILSHATHPATDKQLRDVPSFASNKFDWFTDNLGGIGKTLVLRKFQRLNADIHDLFQYADIVEGLADHVRQEKISMADYTSAIHSLMNTFNEQTVSEYIIKIYNKHAKSFLETFAHHMNRRLRRNLYSSDERKVIHTFSSLVPNGDIGEVLYDYFKIHYQLRMQFYFMQTIYLTLCQRFPTLVETNRLCDYMDLQLDILSDTSQAIVLSNNTEQFDAFLAKFQTSYKGHAASDTYNMFIKYLETFRLFLKFSKDDRDMLYRVFTPIIWVLCPQEVERDRDHFHVTAPPAKPAKKKKKKSKNRQPVTIAGSGKVIQKHISKYNDPIAEKSKVLFRRHSTTFRPIMHPEIDMFGFQPDILYDKWLSRRSGGNT